MEGDESLRTVECLRGRLLAERVASRVAKEDADEMGNKVTELENQLRVEIKSRNRVEKRLKLLLKKLNSLNISHVSENLKHFILLEKSDMSSISSSTASSFTEEPKDKEEQPKTQIKNPAKFEIEESLHATASNQSHCSSIEESFSSADKAYSEEPSELKTDYHSSSSLGPSVDEDDNNEENNDQGQDDYVDNSMALVPIDLPKASQPTEPRIVNASVKDVLDALRHAREKLQWSMERRHD